MAEVPPHFITIVLCCAAWCTEKLWLGSPKPLLLSDTEGMKSYALPLYAWTCLPCELDLLHLDIFSVFPDLEAGVQAGH